MKTNQKSLGRNFLAVTTGTGIQFIIQCLILPIFLFHLGIEQYSQWLIAVNIAMFSGFVDLGTLSSTQNKVIYFFKRGHFEKINRTLKQTNTIVLCNTVIVLGAVSALGQVFHFKTSILLIVILTVSSYLSTVFGSFEAITRAHSKVHLGLYASGSLRLIEFFGYIVGLYFSSRSLTAIAIYGLIFKVSASLTFFVLSRRKYNFFKLGRFKPSDAVINLKEGFPFVVVKASDLISNSGLILILSRELSSKDLVLFASAKTFFRLGLQITSLVNYTYGYEMSESWAAKDIKKMKAIIVRVSQVTFALSLFGAMIYLFGGSAIFKIWTNSKLELSQSAIYAGVLYSFFLSINQSQKTKFHAVNKNLKISLIVIFFAIVPILCIAMFSITIELAPLLLFLAALEFGCIITVASVTTGDIANHFAK